MVWLWTRWQLPLAACVALLAALAGTACDDDDGYAPRAFRVAFVDREGGWDVLSVREASGAIRHLEEPGPWRYQVVRWSPDGELIAALRDRPGPDAVAELALFSPDEGELRSVAVGGPLVWAAIAWSPDGSRMLVVSGGEARIFDRDGREVARVEGGPFTPMQPLLGQVWSPDSRLVLVAAEERPVAAGRDGRVVEMATVDGAPDFGDPAAPVIPFVWNGDDEVLFIKTMPLATPSSVYVAAISEDGGVAWSVERPNFFAWLRQSVAMRSFSSGLQGRDPVVLLLSAPRPTADGSGLQAAYASPDMTGPMDDDLPVGVALSGPGTGVRFVELHQDRPGNFSLDYLTDVILDWHLD